MPSVDRTTGELDYAGSRWKWEQNVTQTDVPGIRRVDVRVRFGTDADSTSRAFITGFVGRTQTAAPAWTGGWDSAGQIQAPSPQTPGSQNPNASPTPQGGGATTPTTPGLTPPTPGPTSPTTPPTTPAPGGG
jgi:hypothetical protein